MISNNLIRSKSTSLKLLCTFIALCGAIISGCGKSDVSNSESTAEKTNNVEPAENDSTVAQNKTVSDQPEENTGAQVNQATNPVAQENLVGVWYGESSIDLDAAQTYIATLEPAEAEKFQNILAAFTSIIFGAEFRKDSVLEFDMVITGPNGQQLRDRSIGSWQVLEAADDLMKVATAEYVGEEKEATQKTYLYRFVERDQIQFVPESVHPDLLRFSPRIVLKRVASELDDSVLAEETTENNLR